MNLKKWFCSMVNKHKAARNFNRMRKHIDNIVFSVDPERREALGFCNKFNWIVRFSVGEYAVKYTWQIKGSLISVSLNHEEVALWVDQIRQYDGFIGLNDIKYKPLHVEKYLKTAKSLPVVLINQPIQGDRGLCESIRT